MEAKHFRKGSALDFILTDEGNFDKYFYVSRAIPPTVAEVGNFILSLKENYGPIYTPLESLFQKNGEEILQLMARFGLYNNNWKPDTKLNKLLTDENIAYWLAIFEMGDRTLISYAEKDVVDIQAQKVRDAYENDFERLDGSLEELGKCVVVAELRGIECKGEMDKVFVNHEKRTIIIDDIKTTANSIWQFNSTFKRFNYGFQAAFYVELMRASGSFDGYSIQFRNVVVESEISERPAVISPVLDEIVMAYTDYDFPSLVNTTVREAIESYKYHLESGQWVYPARFVKSNTLLDKNSYFKSDY
jgi:hypothetical protein